MNYKLIILISFFTISHFAQAQNSNNWTHFRGSNMDGHADVNTAPVHWSDSTNIVWKAKVKGLGWSSPVVFGNQIWVTSGKRRWHRILHPLFRPWNWKTAWRKNYFYLSWSTGYSRHQFLRDANSLYRRRFCLCPLRNFWHRLHQHQQFWSCLETRGPESCTHIRRDRPHQWFYTKTNS